MEQKRWCGACDCRTLQKATSNLESGIPVWQCLNCLAEFQRVVRKVKASIRAAYETLGMVRVVGARGGVYYE